MYKPHEKDIKILNTSVFMNEKAVSYNIPVTKMYKWTDDSMTLQCFRCNVTFNFYTRKHHCRCCGRIFCYACSSYTKIIPLDISLMYNKDNTVNLLHQRVCYPCFMRISEYETLNFRMQFFKNKYNNNVILAENILIPDLVFLYKIKRVCKVWNEWANLKLDLFRALQYALPNHKFTMNEKQLLWVNRKYLVHHPKYLVQLLKSENNENIKYLLKKKQKKKSELSCKYMMCSKYCSKKKENIDVMIELLTENITCPVIRTYALTMLSPNDTELENYIPFLVFNIRYDKIDPPENLIITNYLLKLCSSINIVFIIYYEVKIYLEETKTLPIYKHFFDLFMDYIPEKFKNKLVNSDLFISTLSELKSKRDKNVLDQVLSKLDPKKIVIPLKPEYTCISVNIKESSVNTTSYTSPLIIPLVCENEKKEKVNFNILYKFEDIRKDRLIMSFIKMINRIVKDDLSLDTDCTTYGIFPVSKDCGFIEIVPKSHTIRYIQSKLGFTIQNYIIEKNKKKQADEIRTKFIKSCALYCVSTYIFGIGDRHLDNMMLTQDGSLFHIDYGYILGFDPKPLNTPTMRIPMDMIDAIGGIKSEYYTQFLDLCNKIYNSSRKHINLFINMISIITKCTPPIITSSEEFIYNELYTRLLPGENYKQAEIQLYKIISNSSTEFQYYNMIDLFHSCSNTVYSTSSSIISYIYSNILYNNVQKV